MQLFFTSFDFSQDKKILKTTRLKRCECRKISNPKDAQTILVSEVSQVKIL